MKDLVISVLTVISVELKEKKEDPSLAFYNVKIAIVGASRSVSYLNWKTLSSQRYNTRVFGSF